VGVALVDVLTFYEVENEVGGVRLEIVVMITGSWVKYMEDRALGREGNMCIW
jgi:hypothetical protein